MAAKWLDKIHKVEYHTRVLYETYVKNHKEVVQNLKKKIKFTYFWKILKRMTM